MKIPRKREVIEIEESLDSEDNLSEVSLKTNISVKAEQLKTMLQGLSDSQHASAKFLGDLAQMVTGISKAQLDNTTQQVAS